MYSEYYRDDLPTLKASIAMEYAAAAMNSLNPEITHDIEIVTKRMFKLRGANARYGNSPNENERKKFIMYNESLKKDCDYLISAIKDHYENVKLSDITDNQLAGILYAFDKIRESKSYLEIVQENAYKDKPKNQDAENKWKYEIYSKIFETVSDMEQKTDCLIKINEMPKGKIMEMNSIYNESDLNKYISALKLPNDIAESLKDKTPEEKREYIESNCEASGLAVEELKNMKKKINALGEKYYAKIKGTSSDMFINSEIKKNENEIAESIKIISNDLNRSEIFNALSDTFESYMEQREIEYETTIPNTASREQKEMFENEFDKNLLKADSFGKLGDYKAPVKEQTRKYEMEK